MRTTICRNVFWPTSSRRLGCSVAVSGDTVVVGAYGNDDAGSLSGSAYIYRWSGSRWIEQAKLTASDAEEHDWFGVSVDLDRDTLVVGADSERSAATGIDGDQSDNSSPFSGAVYIFE